MRQNFIDAITAKVRSPNNTVPITINMKVSVSRFFLQIRFRKNWPANICFRIINKNSIIKSRKPDSAVDVHIYSHTVVKAFGVDHFIEGLDFVKLFIIQREFQEPFTTIDPD